MERAVPLTQPFNLIGTSTISTFMLLYNRLRASLKNVNEEQLGL